MCLMTVCGISGAGLILMGGLFGWIIFPILLTKEVHKILNLAPESGFRDTWEFTPVKAEVKIYVFNVTNSKAAEEGAVPSVMEVGPYVFNEMKEREVIEDDNRQDTVSYYTKNTYFFSKEKSAPLTGKEMVFMPNALLLGIIMAAHKETPFFLNMLETVIPSLFANPSSVFFKETALNYLFRGSMVDCSSGNVAATILCTRLKFKKATLMQSNTTQVYMHSLMGLKNGTRSAFMLTANRGFTDPGSFAQITAVDGSPKHPTWEESPCNEIKGTDGSFFTSGLKEFAELWVHSTDLCRSLAFKYLGKAESKGLSLYQYTWDFGDIATDPDLRCFCPKPKNCPKKGVMDLSYCAGLPLFASLPHFYKADESYAKGVLGLSANKVIHEPILEVEPITGMVISAKMKVMFSMPISSVKGISVMKNFTSTMLPIFWVEEVYEMNEQNLEKLTYNLRLYDIIEESIKWGCIALGVLLLILTAYLCYRGRRVRKKKEGSHLRELFRLGLSLGSLKV